MSGLHLVADDLTGALDSTAQFTGRFGTIPVLLHHKAVPPAHDFAIDLACRDDTEAEAVARTRATAASLAAADIAFKKIDSLLRGHWAAELAALLAMRLFARVVLAPAFPAQGRVMRDGRQHASDARGVWRIVETDPAMDLARYGVAVSRDMDARSCPGGAPQIVLCDATNQSDLEALVRTGRTLKGSTLWCGSAGLAGALAGSPSRSVAVGNAAHLVVVGSNHQTTWQQIGIVAERHPHWLARFDADGAASAARINRTLAEQGRCLVHADLPPGLRAAEAAAVIERWLRNLVPHLDRPGLLTTVGGEMFAKLCAALEVRSVDAEGEWCPGVPASRLTEGPWSGLRCFSKSGAFGETGLLHALLR